MNGAHGNGSVLNSTGWTPHFLIHQMGQIRETGEEIAHRIIFAKFCVIIILSGIELGRRS